MLEFLGQVLKLNIPVGWGPLTNMAAVGCLWFFFLLSHLFGNYLTDSNETCLLCSTQCLVVQVQKKSLVRRQIWPFGSRLGQWNFPLTGFLSHLLQDHWSDFFRSWSECSPQCLVVQKKKKTICRKTWLPSAIFEFSCYRISSETTGWSRIILAC